MKKQNEMTETVLTVAELKKMGEMIADIIDTIELYNHALNITPAPQKIDSDTYVAQYYALYELTDTMFHKNQKIMKELDYIGYTLLENTDASEIERTRKKFN